MEIVIHPKTHLLAPSAITPYDKNARDHDQQQVTRIAESIRRFGFNQPLVLDSDKVILVGHGRFEAAKLLELKEIPCIILHNLSDEDKIAYRILDNKLQNDSTWNIGFLESELKALQDVAATLAPFAISDLNELLPRGNEFTPENNSTPPPPPSDPRHYVIVHFRNEEDLQSFVALPQLSSTGITCESKELEFRK